MDKYNVNELNTVNGTPDEIVAESPADEVANEVTAADEVVDDTANEVPADDVNLADLVEQGGDDVQAIDGRRSPLFDSITLFLIMMVIGFVTCLSVCHLFGNWYLGFMLGGYLGTALGLVALFVRKFGLKK
ncbi:MAG: hypothetical protein IJO58_03880 [Clostridia bacterium]|nr:hypothetical protein [Clostridia bacterium]